MADVSGPSPRGSADGQSDSFSALVERVAKRAVAREGRERGQQGQTVDERATALGLSTAARPARSGAATKGRKGATARKPAAKRGKTSGSGRGGGSASTVQRPRSLLGRIAFSLATGIRRAVRLVLYSVLLICLLVVAGVAATRFVSPPGGFYMASEYFRLGGLEREWVPIDTLPPTIGRTAVAAEDARFCMHHGIDVEELRRAAADYLNGDRVRGASTITQQTAKNLFLWHGRSLFRKGLELPFVGLMELLWGKERILEVYLNIAEFDEGVFGIEAAAQHYYGVTAAGLSRNEAARLMTLLPSPKARDPRRLSGAQSRRASQIAAGARTIAARGDDQCFVR
ncbi:MAG: monofunctional biosynthetic peptidoglycan transglycosylase [Pseudomonadota bacterium]